MTVMINGKEHLSAAEAAGQLATTQLKILMLLKNKALTGEQIDGEWYVTADSLAYYLAHGQDQVVAQTCHTSCGSTKCGCR